MIPSPSDSFETGCVTEKLVTGTFQDQPLICLSPHLCHQSLPHQPKAGVPRMFYFAKLFMWVLRLGIQVLAFMVRQKD